MNIIIPIKLNKSLDFKKLLDFSKKFPFFLAEFPKDILKKQNGDEKVLNSIKLKYKRISLFANMNDILLDIDIMKQNDKDITFILKSLEKKYQKSIDEVKGYLLEWEKKYSSSKTSKINSEYRSGINVMISNNNIIFSGVTKIYQIPLLYKFFVLFLTLFLNYEDFLKNSQFKKIFDKNANIKYHESKYEIDENATLDIDQLYDMDYDIDLDDDLIIDKELDFVYNEEALETNKQKIIGLALDNELQAGLKLTCDDPMPEKDTCADFCNDDKYFLRRLQRYDNKLFKFNIDKKIGKKQYSRKCQTRKQPIVLPYNPETNDKINRDSYTTSVKYSSEPERFDRWYICPKIWCPYCEIPILEADIDPKTIRIRIIKGETGKCKTAICPNGPHQVFIRDRDNETFIYPGFQDSTDHPKGFCLPCCFKKSQESQESSAYKRFKKCIGDDVNNEDIKDGDIYILGKGMPIDKDRYGKLSVEIARILKTNLETGYLRFKYGYLRKGIKQYKNNSFLSAICDILSCDKNNFKFDVHKIKKMLVEKLNIDIFRSLYSGNLQNIFHNPKSKLTPLENFKNYILNDLVEINHKYLWDFLQRPNILFDEGVNIFIFNHNNLLCPFGENINNFYDINKRSILLINYKEYYEPIYYLEGDGKGAKQKLCIFDNNSDEIKKIFEISSNGCKSEYDIDWINVLCDNIKKYDIKIDNVTISLGDSLQTLLNEILLNIKNKNLNNTFLPNIQYVDSYNKVFGIKLNNGLYIPTAPSKLIDQLKYKVIIDVNDIDKISFKDVIKYTNEISKKTNLKCKITHKILDIKDKKNIIALVNENNRFIPIHVLINKDKTLKISSLNYFSDVDEALQNKIQYNDKRLEQINKKNFEDETYIRMKFELSKFLYIKENSNYLNQILAIINSDNTNIIENRSKMYKVLNNIYSKIVLVSNSKIEYYDYKTPNKRIPCFLRANNNNINKKLSCDSDPHCTYSNNKCLLYINKYNLLDTKKSYDNFNYYLSKIVDELLRYEMKRNEILNDNIPNIINKELVEENPNKYIIIHTLNYNEINNLIDKLFIDTKGIFIDNRNLYEEVSTKEIAFKKSDYIKSNKKILQNNKTDDLTVHWQKFLGYKFKVNLDYNINNSLYSIFMFALNNELNMPTFKNKIIEYIKRNENSYENIINLYKKNNDKTFKYISSIQSLLDEILNDMYEGTEVELDFIAKIFNINIVVLDKRLKKDKVGYKVYKSNDVNDVNDATNIILLYKSLTRDNNNKFNLIQLKNNIMFDINDLPQKFTKLIFNH